jgi:hypothetical protein
LKDARFIAVNCSQLLLLKGGYVKTETEKVISSISLSPVSIGNVIPEYFGGQLSFPMDYDEPALCAFLFYCSHKLLRHNNLDFKDRVEVKIRGIVDAWLNAGDMSFHPAEKVAAEIVRQYEHYIELDKNDNKQSFEEQEKYFAETVYKKQRLNPAGIVKFVMTEIFDGIPEVDIDITMPDLSEAPKATQSERKYPEGHIQFVCFELSIENKINLFEELDSNEYEFYWDKRKSIQRGLELSEYHRLTLRDDLKDEWKTTLKRKGKWSSFLSFFRDNN